jgi:hypothetical protein
VNRWHVPANFETIVWPDFEFAEGSTSNRLRPTSLVAINNHGHKWRWWREQLLASTRAPFDVGPSTLLVFFKAETDLTCFLALGWRLPCHIIDLYSEWRHRSNGAPHPLPENSLLNVAAHYGIDTTSAAAKEHFRAMFIADAPFSPKQREEALDYNEGDVRATRELYYRMHQEQPFLLPAACYRGRYTKAVARVQHEGVPLDLDIERRFRRHHRDMLRIVVEEGTLRVKSPADEVREFHVYNENYSLLPRLLLPALHHAGIRNWPLTPLGLQIATDKETLKRMAEERGDEYPWLHTLQQTNRLATVLENWKVRCGDDGRNRYSVMPFGTLTGRNAASSNEYIFGLPAGMRPLIKPPHGCALAYCDWSAQEPRIAAALSGDKVLSADCEQADPYIAFARRAGRWPEHGTPETQKRVRKLFKTALLAVMYGQGALSLAARIKATVSQARALLLLVQQLYPVFWAWSQQVVRTATQWREIRTPFDKWRFTIHEGTKSTTLRNYMMQGTGASIMRLALIMATEERLRIGGVVHDAFLLVSTPDQVERDAQHLQDIMRDAARQVCGVTIPVDVDIIRWPARYWDAEDEPACKLWLRLLALSKRAEAAAEEIPTDAPVRLYPRDSATPGESLSLLELGVPPHALSP